MKTFLIFIKHSWIGFTLIILTAITALSLWPMEKLPLVPGTDKTHHFIAYAALMFPAALRTPDKWTLICLLFIAYGGLIELVQPYVNRYGEWLDMGANTGGVVCGLIIAGLINKILPVTSNRSQS